MECKGIEINTVRALKEGNHQAFNKVFELFWDKVYAYLVKKTGSPEAAKELTQLVFIKIWKYRSTLSEQIALNEQIFRKTKQTFIDWLRQEIRKRKYFSKNEKLNDRSSENHYMQNFENQNHVFHALKTLPPKRKEIFELKHIHGYSYKEISELLGISIKTVDNQLLKANLQLRKVLEAVISTFLLSSIADQII